MTSALYPYVHTQACGMSNARYSSGQKTVDGAGAADVGLEEGPCACPVSVAEDRLVRRVNKDLSRLDFLVASMLPLLAVAAASQVSRG